MSKKAEAFLKFVQAASSLAKQGVKKSEILKFAKLQFGKVTDEITKAVDNIFEKSPLQKILDRRSAVKRSVEERKVLDMDGNVLDPNQPILAGKQDKGITTLETEFTPTQAAEDIFPSGDYKYDMDMAAESYVENNPGMFKNMLYEDLDQKTQMEVYEKVSKIINQKNAEKIKAKKANPESTKPKGFQLNVEKFVQDFPVSKEEALRISKLPTEEQQKIIKTYLDEDFSQQITLMDFEPPKDRKPNATGGRAGFSEAGSVRKDPDEIVAGMDNELNPGFFDQLPLIGGYEGKYPVDADQGASLIEEIQDYKYGESYPNKTIGVMEEGVFNVIPKPDRPPMSMEETIKALEAKWDMAIEEGYEPGKGGEFDDLGIYSKEDIRRRVELGYDQAKGPEIKTGIMTAAAGGRAGYYGGGQAMVEPDLSDIGHGSDALMARTRITAPGSQATTSTGLNYLLGEDNDNIRIPFNDGLLVPPAKPYTEEMFEDDSMTLLKGMYGTGKDSNEFLYNEMIKKGNILRNQGVERETVIEIIRNNKDKINAFLETQTGDKKSLKGIDSIIANQYIDEPKFDEYTDELKFDEYIDEKADGGRIGFQDGLNFKKFYGKKLDKALDKMLEKETEVDKDLFEEGKKEFLKKTSDKATDIFETKPTRDKFPPGRLGDKEYELSLNKYNETEKGKKEQENEMFKMVEEFQTLKKKGIIDRNTPFERFKKMKAQRLIKNKILELDIKYPEKEIINKETGALNEENLKSAIDQAQIDLEISPTDGLTLKRSLNTEGEQSVTGGEYTTGNLKFSSDNIEEGKLTSKGNFNFGGIDLSGMVDSNDGQILNTELGFNYDNALKGKMQNSDGYRKTEFDLTKNFTLPSKFTEASATSDGYDMIPPKIKNKKLKNVLNNFDFGIKGNYDITESNGQTRISSDLTPKLSYNKGIFNADIYKEILEGGGDFSLNAGASFPLFEKTFTGDLILDVNGKPTYNSDGSLKRKSNTTKDMGVVTLKGTDLFTDKMGGTIGYKKDIFDKDNLKFSLGGEIDPFTGDKTAGGYIKYKYADGGIAGLRQGYSKGKGVDLARRGFLKVLGGTVGAIAAFKTGALKLLGKTSTTKAIPEVVKIAEGSGAPAWFEPMVNKVLADGLDITKKNATMDGQIVKSLDTPTGKVEVNYDTRSGSVDVNYSGENTALGEGVDMRYVVGQADETTKVKPFDEFEAVENIPEGQMSSPNDYNVEFAENATSDVKNLYSDTLELEKLGGQNPLIKDISNSINKKRKLKQMNENPDKFASDNLRDDFPNYDYDDVNPNYD